jgi:hypothetical protein
MLDMQQKGVEIGQSSEPKKRRLGIVQHLRKKNKEGKLNIKLRAARCRV